MQRKDTNDQDASLVHIYPCFLTDLNSDKVCIDILE